MILDVDCGERSITLTPKPNKHHITTNHIELFLSTGRFRCSNHQMVYELLCIARLQKTHKTQTKHNLRNQPTPPSRHAHFSNTQLNSVGVGLVNTPHDNRVLT